MRIVARFCNVDLTLQSVNDFDAPKLGLDIPLYLQSWIFPVD